MYVDVVNGLRLHFDPIAFRRLGFGHRNRQGPVLLLYVDAVLSNTGGQTD